MINSTLKALLNTYLMKHSKVVLETEVSDTLKDTDWVLLRGASLEECKHPITWATKHSHCILFLKDKGFALRYKDVKYCRDKKLAYIDYINGLIQADKKHVVDTRHKFTALDEEEQSLQWHKFLEACDKRKVLMLNGE